MKNKDEGTCQHWRSLASRVVQQERWLPGWTSQATPAVLSALPFVIAPGNSALNAEREIDTETSRFLPADRVYIFRQSSVESFRNMGARLSGLPRWAAQVIQSRNVHDPFQIIGDYGSSLADCMRFPDFSSLLRGWCGEVRFLYG